MEWTTSCIDWEERLVRRQSIIPPPIFANEAESALFIFKSLKVVDLPKVWDEDLGEMRAPTFGECSEEWVFDYVRVIFGGYNSELGQQLIREYGLLISKKNTKSTIAAGIMLTALILCWREDEEHLILAPTKEVADNSYKPAASMVRADEELSELFHIQDHVRTITHRVNRNSLKVVAADTDTVSGKKSGKVLVDELWLFGKKASSAAMLLEALGGQISRDEGWVIYLTTQSDEPPAGVFKEKLDYWRDVRDGKIHDPKTLGVLYEFPQAMVKSKAYMHSDNFYVTNPNLGKSVSRQWLEDELRKHEHKKDGTFQQFLAKHLNIQIGLNLRSDRWAGADFWEAAAIEVFSLEELLERCEVAVVGIDGGGLDDLLGLVVLGREKDSRRLLCWGHGWAHEIVLTRRTDIAAQLQDFAAAGELTIVKSPGEDVKDVADIVCKVRDAGLLPEERGIGVDAAGIVDIVEELVTDERGIKLTQIVAIRQGFMLNGAIKTCERMVAAKTLVHAGSALLAWCVSNARIEDKGNAILVTKAASGKAKIDLLMALFDAVSLMANNPQAAGGRSFWDK